MNESISNFEAEDDRPSTMGEEIANSISHGLALLGALAAAPILIVTAVHKSDAQMVVAVSLFAASMILLYLSSMIYHCLPINRAKRVFQIFDHISIFILIAGSYMPFALGVLRGPMGWTLFGLIWALAVLGIVTKLVPKLRHSKISLILYLGMGWLIILVIYPLYLHLPFAGLLWLFAGGMAYTLGVIFYVSNAKYAHFIWHLFTIAGTACHFFAVLWYAIR